jgi:hypothetical protein
MTDILIMWVLPLALVAVMVSLVMGLIAMNKAGDEARARSNVMMRWRIGFQVLALVIIMAIVALRQLG